MPRKVIKQLLPNHPHYWEIVMLPPTNRHLRKFMRRGHFLLETPKGTKPASEEIEHARVHGLKIPPLGQAVHEYAMDKFFDQRIPGSRKEEIRRALKREIDAAHAETGSKFRTSLDMVVRLDTVRDIFANAQIGRVFRHSSSGPLAELAEKIQLAILQVGVAYVLQAHFRAKGIPGTLHQIIDTSRASMFGRTKGDSLSVMDPEYIITVERNLLKENKKRRAANYVTTVETNREIRSFLHAFRKKIARYIMPRVQRREIERLLRQQKADGAANTDFHLKKAHKYARLHLMQQLKEAGFNPDRTINELGVEAGKNGNRLKAIGYILNRIPPEQHAQKIRQWLLRNGRKGVGAAIPAQTTRSPATMKGSPRTAEEKKRDKPPREEKKPAQPLKKAPTSKPAPLPESFKGVVQLAEKTPHVTHEMYVRLRDLLSNESAKKPKLQNKELMRRAMRITLLSFIATEYGMSGRLHEDFLKTKYRNTLHELLDECVADLIRQNFLEYEQHYGHKRNLALTSYAKEQGVLQKYSSRATRRP